MANNNISPNEITKVKGSAISIIPEFIKTTFGDEKYNEWFSELPPESQKIFSGFILKSNWYSLQDTYVIPLQLMCDKFYNGSVEGIRAGAIYSANKSLSGFYKFLIQLGSPEFFLNKAATISKTYYMPSEAKFVSDGKGAGRIIITGFNGMHNVVEERQMSWVKRGLELSGAKNVTISCTKSLTKGDDCTELSVTWE